MQRLRVFFRIFWFLTFAAIVMAAYGDRVRLVGDQAFRTLTLLPADDRPPVLGQKTRGELSSALEELEALPPERLLVVSDDEDWFCAGADVDEIASVTSSLEARSLSRSGQTLLQRLADLPSLTAAAVHGDALGGGLELALACDAIILSADPEVGVGLPEVKLGIIPGFGGTQRLPRRIGLQDALKMILTGRAYTPRQARDVGLSDRTIDTEGFRGHAACLLRNWNTDAFEDRGESEGILTELMEGTRPGRKMIFRSARKKTRAKSGEHYPAPFAAIDAIQNGLQEDLETGLEIEADTVSELAQKPESQQLIRLFQNTRNLQEVGDGPEAPMRGRAGVIGAGVMGGSIAQLFAYNQIACRMKDVDPEPLKDGLRNARSIFQKGVDQNRWTQDFVEERMALITPTLNWRGFRRRDVIVEAVPERLDVKRQVFSELERHTDEGTILATNTSSFRLSEIAEEMDDPSRLIGLHFFNPVRKMKLVEVVYQEGVTDPAWIERARRIVSELDRVPVTVRDGPGFLVNRLLFFYLQEAMLLYREGAGVEQVDEVMEAFGMPQGPFEVMDQVGLDIAAHVTDTLQDAFPDRSEGLQVLGHMTEREWLGKKSGRGFYQYDEDDRTVNRDLGGLINRNDREPGEREIRDRLLFMLINEAVRVMNEEIVDSSDALDTAMILGTGFAPFRGGPWTYASTRGWDELRTNMEAFADTHGDRFDPARSFPGARDTASGHGNDADGDGAANDNPSGSASNDASGKVEPSLSVQPEPPDGDAPQPDTALVFSGGGARGAYEAGVLSGLCKHVMPRLDEKPKINVLVGTSSGAVNAYYLAGCLDRIHEGVEEMVEHWKNLHLEEHLVPASTGTFSLLRWLLGSSEKQRMSILDPSSIRAIIKNDFPWERIRSCMSEGLLHSLCITATELHTGETVLFTDSVEDELPAPPVGRYLNWVRTQILPIHVFGSSSIPLLYPATRIDGTLFYDGGLRMDIPITPALSLGAENVLVIGVKTPKPDVPGDVLEEAEEGPDETPEQRYPGAPEMIGKILNALLLDPVERERSRIFALQDIIDDTRETHGSHFSEQLAEALTAYIGGNLSETSFYFHRPENDIGKIAKAFVPDVADRLGGLWGRIFHRFASSRATGNWDLASYMLFDEAYTTELIEQGEQDVYDNQASLTSFFRSDD